MTTRSRLLLFVAALPVALTAGALAARPLDVYVPGLGAVPAEKAARVEHVVPGPEEPVEAPTRAPRPSPAFDHVSAHLLPVGAPIPVSAELLSPSNGWLVSDGRTVVAVYAGADGRDARRGRFVIVRKDVTAGTQTETVVDADADGPVSITGRPETTTVPNRLTFRTEGGRAGVLDLTTDTARLAG